MMNIVVLLTVMKTFVLNRQLFLVCVEFLRLLPSAEFRIDMGNCVNLFMTKIRCSCTNN